MGISKDDLPKDEAKFFKANHTRTWFGNRSCGGRRDHSAAWRYAGINNGRSGTTVMITLPCIEQKKKLTIRQL